MRFCFRSLIVKSLAIDMLVTFQFFACFKTFAFVRKEMSSTFIQGLIVLPRGQKLLIFFYFFFNDFKFQFFCYSFQSKHDYIIFSKIPLIFHYLILLLLIFRSRLVSLRFSLVLFVLPEYFHSCWSLSTVTSDDSIY